MTQLSENKFKQLKDFIQGCSAEELIWTSGYIQGKLDAGNSNKLVADNSSKPRNITVLYGTESGNSKKLATKLTALGKQEGLPIKLKSLEQYPVSDLAKEEYVFGIVSTQGEGEPPIAAKSFFDSIGQSDQNLSHLKFGILALGDTSYPLFCKAGEDLDGRLIDLGASQIIPLKKCDTDYESEADNWFSSVLEILKLGQIESAQEIKKTQAIKAKTRTKGKLKTHILLNDIGSNKMIYHLEIEPKDRLDYLPGDSLSILPQNPKEVVSRIIQVSEFTPETVIHWRGEDTKLLDILTVRAQILYLSKRVVSAYASKTGQNIPEMKIDLLDLLLIYPVESQEQFLEIIDLLEPLSPRLYSISSSPNAHDHEIHLTVALDVFEVAGIAKKGLCSSFLSQLTIDDELDISVHTNNNFRLPENDRDIIMIGPGTGIAPFRSFLFERDAQLARGKNWLFFGEQHAQFDFLYQTEIQDFISSKLISKINLAFSRDQKEKVYVWHEMLREAESLMNWLEEGAYLYVCGSRNPMSEDVERTLQEIISNQKGISLEDSKLYLENLSEEGRYLKDVY